MADPTVLKGKAIASDEYLAERIKLEIRDVIFRKQGSATPLTNLVRGLKKEPTNNYKFNWLKDDIMPWRTEVKTAATSTVTTITIDSNAGFPEGTILLNVDSGETMLVTGRSGDDELAVTRSIGATASVSLHTNDGIYALGRAYKEDETLGSIYMTKVTIDFNYCQIFRTPIGGSGRDEVTGLYGGRNRAHQRLQAGLAHRRDIENAFIFSEKYVLATSGSTNIRSATGGVLQFITTNRTDAAGTITETEFDTFMESMAVYDDGTTDRLLIASDILISAIGFWAKQKGTYSLEGAHKYYGVELVDYHSPHGMVHLAKASQTLLGAYGGGSENRYRGVGIALDMSDLKYRYMEGRDTQLLIDRQENDRDGWRDEFLTDAGLEMHFEDRHGEVYGFSNYAA